MSARKTKQASSDQDSEVYWQDSSLPKFNFNEDDEEDSIEVTNWDGSSAQPQRTQGQSNQNYKPAAVGTTATSARAFPRKPASASQSVKFSRGGSGITNATVTPLEQKHSKAGSDGKVSSTTLAKLETERNTLIRQLNQAKRDRATAPSIQDTLKRFMLSDPVVLELYRSVDEKTKLLDEAIRRHDGNAILAITLFMRNTLKRELFSKELMSRPTAVDHYCAYLQAVSETEELHEILTILGRTEEAAMLKYRHCLNHAKSPEVRINGLNDCIKYYFESDPRLVNEKKEIKEQASLLYRQTVIDGNDKKTQESGMYSIFQTHPRRESLCHKSLTTTLYYCCYYHWGENEGILSSPTSLRNEFKIGDKQFTYMAVAALCRMRKWRDLEQHLTIPKSMFRSARLHAVIGFDKVVDVLSKNLAPPDAIMKYCQEIENTETRLEMAEKLKVYKVVIDTLIQLKDRQQLMSYLGKIPDSNQHMRQYLLSELKRPEIKWKN